MTSGRIPRPRRLLVVAGLASLATGIFTLVAAMMPPAASANGGAATGPAPATGLAPATGASPDATASTPPMLAGGSSFIVKGPHMWDPRHHRQFPFASSVTVNQTRNLVNQEIHLSWRGFTPSSTVVYDATATDYPVMVAECKGLHPTRMDQCYGANNGGVQGAFGAFGPMNTVYETTAPKGRGELDIQILTVQENQFLDCDENHPCSLVMVPAQGGDVFVSPPHCKDHSLDQGTSDIGQVAFSTGTGACSWRDRITIPLRFAPTPDGCPLRNANFSVIGSPMMARAMDSWRAGLCQGTDGLAIQYNSAIPEPLAVNDVQHHLGNVALTTRPAPGGSGGNFVYAPVAVTASSVTYWIDNPRTGLPARNMRLGQRLLLKMLTQSYNFENEGCSAHKKPPKNIGCDGSVDGNPITLFADPEFKHLNPTIKQVVGLGAQFQVPTVQSGHSDMSWTVTRWIAGNKAANKFLHGTFDPWGMHVNTNYLGLNYPVDSFTGEDSYPVIAHKYSPVFPLSLVAMYQAENWEPGTDWEKDQFGNFPKDPIQVPGERALVAVLDQADAVAYRFPVAGLRNTAGRYVKPSNASMAQALKHMQATGKGVTQTLQVNLNNRDPKAYPLTMVVYAMVPTSGLSHNKAAAIARFLEFVAGRGQRAGTATGQLPLGYLPLNATLRAQTLKAATDVADQSGSRGGHAGQSSPTPSPSLGGTPSASASPSPSLSLPPATASAPPGQITVSLASAKPASLTRFALPALLIFGGLAALGGSSALAETTGLTGWLQRLAGSVAARRRAGKRRRITGRGP
jgi:hypothetical protein